MGDFLLKNYTILTHSVEAISAITGIVLFKKYKQSHYRYFIFFLIYLSVGDLFNNYTKLITGDGLLKFLRGTIFEKNYWWSNLFWNLGAILFFAFFYQKVLKTEKFKRYIKISGIVFSVVCVTYIVCHWDEYFTSFFPLISVAGAFVIFLCAVFYFFETLISDTILTFYKSLNFYISFSIFIWWLIITPIVFYDIYGQHKDLAYLFLRRYIYLFANIFMYLTFTFALIWCRPKNG